MNAYQFFAERKRTPPAVTRLISGKFATIIAAEAGKPVTGMVMVPDDWWANQCKSRTS